MAKTARRPAPKSAKLGSIRPMLLAVGLGLFWFVEIQEGGGQPEAPVWGYMMVLGTRLLADIVGAWCVVSGVLLALSAVRIGLVYLRSLWMRENA